MLARGEDAVDVAQLEPGVAHGVADRLQVEGQLAFAREHPHLVALVHPDDAGRVLQLFHRALPFAGWNSGTVCSSVSLWNTTSTGMSHVTCCGSAVTFTRFVIMRGPSSSSTIART